MYIDTEKSSPNLKFIAPIGLLALALCYPKPSFVLARKSSSSLKPIHFSLLNLVLLLAL